MTEGGNVLVSRQRQVQALEHQKAIGQQDQGQMPMQAVPASPLVLIQPAFPLGIFVKLLNDVSGPGPASLTAPTRFLVVAC